jgi:hypothetical protein
MSSFGSYEEFHKLMNLSDKGSHHGYQRFYYPLLKDKQHHALRMLEIGVESGKSMKIWQEYFKNANHIYGIGYKNFQKQYMEKVNDNTTIFMGDQSDKVFLSKFIEDSGGKFDLIIDDGSHVPSHIQISFEKLWDCVNDDGLYIIEDIETSYWKKNACVYGYSLKNEGSVIEYFKNKVDEINNEFINNKSNDIASITFVQNMIILKKISSLHSPYLNRSYRFQDKI